MYRHKRAFGWSTARYKFLSREQLEALIVSIFWVQHWRGNQYWGSKARVVNAYKNQTLHEAAKLINLDLSTKVSEVINQCQAF